MVRDQAEHGRGFGRHSIKWTMSAAKDTAAKMILIFIQGLLNGVLPRGFMKKQDTPNIITPSLKCHQIGARQKTLLYYEFLFFSSSRFLGSGRANHSSRSLYTSQKLTTAIGFLPYFFCSLFFISAASRSRRRSSKVANHSSLAASSSF